jgi:CBS domain containing-hemolysin-like protein
MVPSARLASIEVSTPLPEVLRLVATSPYSRLPVYRRTPDDIIGILHTKDVVTRFITDGKATSLTSLLRPIASVHDSIPADHLLAYMRDKRIHQVLVVGEGGQVAGMITLEDVVAELIGGVSDEFKGAPARAILLPDGSVRVPGAMRVDHAAQVLGAPWKSHSPGETVGTFITQSLGGVPAPGEQVTLAGVELIVEAVEGDAASSAVVLPPGSEATE